MTTCRSRINTRHGKTICLVAIVFMNNRSRRQISSTFRNRLRKLQKKWTIEEGKIMVKMIEERPAIWDYRSSEYRNLENKNKCWLEIAEKTSHSVADAKNHWNTVKSRFNMERKKVLQQAGTTYSSKFELYQPLQFLTTVGEAKPPGGTSTNSIIKTEILDFEDSSSTSDSDDAERITTWISNKRKHNSSPPPATPRNRRRIEEVTPAKRWKKVFAEYISCELDRYEDHNAQRLKNQILTVCVNFQPEPYVDMESTYSG